MKVLIASNNLGKVAIYKAVFDKLGIETTYPKELGIVVDVEENGKTETENAKASAEKIKGKTIRFSLPAGQGGRLFGSVTTKEIAEKIKKEFGVTVDKKKISVSDIKAYGTYTAEVKLYQGITAEIFVFVGE